MTMIENSTEVGMRIKRIKIKPEQIKPYDDDQVA